MYAGDVKISADIDLDLIEAMSGYWVDFQDLGGMDDRMFPLPYGPFVGGRVVHLGPGKWGNRGA